MSKSVVLSLLAQGNTGSEILTILDSIVADIEQENIDDVATYFAALWYTHCVPLVVRQSVSDVDTGGALCYDAWMTPFDSVWRLWGYAPWGRCGL